MSTKRNPPAPTKVTGAIQNTSDSNCSKLTTAMRGLHDWLCRMICGDRLFNQDMSLEIDRLTLHLKEWGRSDRQFQGKEVDNA